MFIIFLFYPVCLSGVFRPGHPTVSRCFPPPPTSMLLSPPLFSCGGAPPNRGSFDWKDGCSPAEKDGLQVNYHGNQCFAGLPSFWVIFDLMSWQCTEALLMRSSYSLHSFFPPFLFSRKSQSPGGLVSGGLGVGKLVLRTGPPRLGDASMRACPETPVTEMLLNGS